MYRQSSSRNQRSKGIRIKHVLQICLLLAVCFWLIYQVKHSHDKKKEFDESDAKAVLDEVNKDERIKLGRKDIRPQVEGAISKNVKQEEPEEEDETSVEEVEEIRHEEDEPGDKKVEAKEDKELGAEDDETDEHEPEKSDAEVGEEDVVDDDEKESSDETETHETDSEDGQGQTEKESSTEETDHDGDDSNTHEAREENYKADDASSAVTHNTPIVTNGSENELVGNSKGQHEDIVEVENKENKSEENNEGEMRQDLEVEDEMARDDHKSNVITTEPKVDMLENTANGASMNNTVTEGSDDHLPSDTSPDVTSKTHDLSSQNVTESNPESDDEPGILSEGTSAERVDLQTVASEQDGSSFVNVDTNRPDSNSTGSIKTKDAESHSDEFSDSSNNSTDFSASENIFRSEASVEGGKSTDSTSENNDEMQALESDKSDDIDETSESTGTENPEEVHHDAIDISDSSHSTEETDVRMDLETLPQIQTEGTESEDAAAE